MKKTLFRMFSLTLCAAMVCVLPVLAAEAEDAPGETPHYPALVRAWGRLTKLDDSGLLVQNADPDAPYPEIVLHGESIRVLDAVSGLPLGRELKNGESVYAWVGSAMTESLPPHATAQLIVANIPADAGVPQYYEIARVEQNVTAPAAGDHTPQPSEVTITTTGGQTLTVTDKATLFPHLTKQMVSLGSLVPGSRILVWSGGKGAAAKVMLFAYAYRGYLSWDPAGKASVNSQNLSAAGKVVDGEVLLPIRAVAEAAGYAVDWAAGKGAVVSYSESPVFSVFPGQDTVHTATGERHLKGACCFESGTTYLPAAELASLLNLFPVY